MDNRIRILVVRDTDTQAYRDALRIGERVPCVIDWHSIDRQSEPNWRDALQGAEYDVLDADVSCGNERLAFYRTRVRYRSVPRNESVEAAKDMRPEHAQWALDLYKSCIEDAEADPWFEPGGAERRFIAKLREYAGLRDGGAEKAARRRFGL